MSNSIPRTLNQFVQRYPETADLLSGPISARKAADLINESREAHETGFKVSKTSINRYRRELPERKLYQAPEAPALSDLVNPQTPAARPLPQVQTRGPKVPSWGAGVDVDLAKGEGEIRTVPEILAEGEPDIHPDEIAILKAHGLDPAEWQVTSYRSSKWQTYGGDWLRAHRVSVGKRVGLGSLDTDGVEEILARYPAKPQAKEPGKGTLVVALGDVQMGKGHAHPDDPGAGAIVDRFARCIQQVEERIQSEYAGHCEAIVCALLGDMIESLTSQAGKLPNNLGITEQIRVVRRLVFHMMATLAPYADRVLVMCVPGNHDEPTRVRQLANRDSHAVDAISAVQDMLGMDPKYSHVDFIYPPGFDDLSVAVEVNGVVLGATHGHTFAGPDKAGAWLAGQALGKQPVGSADILLVGHHHTFSARDVGGGRSVIAAPALDNGSQFWVARKGTESQSGVLSFELTQTAPYWHSVELHTGSQN
jgi:predicted phosphodiesterase